MILLNQIKWRKSIDYDAVLLYYDVMEDERMVIHSYGVTVCQEDWSWDTGKYPPPDYDLWTVLQGEGVIATAGKEYEECIEQISGKLGFGDVSFFCRQFKNAGGITPGK